MKKVGGSNYSKIHDESKSVSGMLRVFHRVSRARTCATRRRKISALDALLTRYPSPRPPPYKSAEADRQRPQVSAVQDRAHMVPAYGRGARGTGRPFSSCSPWSSRGCPLRAVVVQPLFFFFIFSSFFFFLFTFA